MYNIKLYKYYKQDKEHNIHLKRCPSRASASTELDENKKLRNRQENFKRGWEKKDLNLPICRGKKKFDGAHLLFLGTESAHTVFYGDWRLSSSHSTVKKIRRTKMQFSVDFEKSLIKPATINKLKLYLELFKSVF